VTPEISSAYTFIIAQYDAVGKNGKHSKKMKELELVARHEQVRVLQPLIYDDANLKITMDMNHQFSRLTGGWISPQFKVVYCFNPNINDSNLQTVFDTPKGMKDRYIGHRKSLPNVIDRMDFVGDIANRFNSLMASQLPYMEGELRKIQGWLNA
jgi:hypothetical protein